jgi:hypothetical protein
VTFDHTDVVLEPNQSPSHSPPSPHLNRPRTFSKELTPLNVTVVDIEYFKSNTDEQHTPREKKFVLRVALGSMTIPKLYNKIAKKVRRSRLYCRFNTDKIEIVLNILSQG